MRKDQKGEKGAEWGYISVSMNVGGVEILRSAS